MGGGVCSGEGVTTGRTIRRLSEASLSEAFGLPDLGAGWRGAAPQRNFWSVAPSFGWEPEELQVGA